MKIYFDLDDTLYEQFQPFQKAYQEMFDYSLDIKELCRKSRQYSNEVFEKSEKGIISKEELYIYRLKTPLQDMGISITDQQALDFQKLYAKKQLEIQLTPTMEEILNLLHQNNVEMGIITNGPYTTQMNKIKALNLFRWFDKENIYISSSVGYSKPDHHIFDIAAKGQSGWFIGDGYDIDILGAHKASWHTIWFNRHLKEGKLIDYMVTNEEELNKLIKKIVL